MEIDALKSPRTTRLSEPIQDSIYRGFVPPVIDGRSLRLREEIGPGPPPAPSPVPVAEGSSFQHNSYLTIRKR